MKKSMKKLVVLLTSLTLMVIMLSGMAMAKEGGLIDSELLKILYEKTDNPELWQTFIEENAEDEIGQWLPLLIKKIASEDETMSKEVVDVKYTTVTEAYDWGPAISKVVIDFGIEIAGDSIDEKTFEVTSIRRFKDLDYATFTYAETATDHEAVRTITKAYVSDSQGNSTEEGSYVAIEMAVGPTLTEGSPFNYNILSGFNDYVETSYRVNVATDGEVLSTEGKALTIIPTDMDEKAGDIKVIADDFVQNQSFIHEDIELLYGSFIPETATVEEGANPLVIWLHGAGEGGTDTTIAMMGNEVVNLATKEYQAYFGDQGAYLLVPQTPTIWMDYDGTHTYTSSVEGSDGSSYYTEALMALIDTYVTDHPEIDTNRIYIGGCSNGGYMTVNMITTYPEYFTAAYPICEAYSAEWLTDEKIEAIKDMPIWMTHALADGVVKIAEGTAVGFTGYDLTLDENRNPIELDDFSNALYTRLMSADADQVYYSQFKNVVDTSGLYTNADGTAYEYMGHWSWIYALNNECVEIIDGEEVTLFGWLGEQSK